MDPTWIVRLDAAGDGRVDVGPVGEIGAEERAADPFGHSRSRPLVEVGDDHVHAFRGEPLRDPGAYPVCTSGHQSRHPVEFHGGSVRPGTDIPRRGTGYLPLKYSPGVGKNVLEDMAISMRSRFGCGAGVKSDFSHSGAASIESL